MYLDKDDHVPHGFDQDDVRATLAQLLVLGETDLEEVGSVLQLLHVCLHHRNSLIRLRRRTFQARSLNVTMMTSSLTLSSSLYGSSMFILKMGSVRNCSLNSCCLTYTERETTWGRPSCIMEGRGELSVGGSDLPRCSPRTKHTSCV